MSRDARIAEAIRDGRILAGRFSRVVSRCMSRGSLFAEAMRTMNNLAGDAIQIKALFRCGLRRFIRKPNIAPKIEAPATAPGLHFEPRYLAHGLIMRCYSK